MNLITINLSEDAKFPMNDNVGKVEILPGNRVMMTFSKNALLGLGHHLIKLANNNYSEGYHVHVDPCELNYRPQVLGFFSHPDSVELIVCCSDFEPINTYTNED